MGLLPNIGVDVPQTIRDFLAALHEINHKLDTLIELQRDQGSTERLARVTAARQQRENRRRRSAVSVSTTTTNCRSMSRSRTGREPRS